MHGVGRHRLPDTIIRQKQLTKLILKESLEVSKANDPYLFISLLLMKSIVIQEGNHFKSSGSSMRLNQDDQMTAINSTFYLHIIVKLFFFSPELTRLWELCPDNLTACKSEKRSFLPTLEGFFADGIELMDPKNMVEEEYMSVKYTVLSVIIHIKLTYFKTWPFD